MRIALITTSWPRDEEDPSGHFVRAEARELERAGHEVRVVAPRAVGLEGDAFGWPGVAARVRARPYRALGAAAWVARAARIAREIRADRVICHWAVPCAWPIVTGAPRTRAELEVVSHGADVRLLRALPAAPRGAVVRRIASRARVWRFASTALLGELTAALGAREADAVRAIARVAAPPIELPDARALRDAARALRAENAGGALYVVAARLVRGKRVDAAIAHVARRAADGEARARLVILGDGPERARLERLARDEGVATRFCGTVARREALAWIAAADALVHASRAEGLSTVVREAEALGTRIERI